MTPMVLAEYSDILLNAVTLGGEFNVNWVVTF